MSQEWPVTPQATAAAEQTLLPLALREHVELILASDAARAFAEKRAQQLLTHGHRAENDALLTIDRLVEFAAEQCVSFLERSGRFRNMNPPDSCRDLLIRKVESAGALLLAAWDRLHMVIPETQGAAE